MDRPASASELAVIAERIAGHERECVERMRRIDERLAEGKHDRLQQTREMRDGFAGIYRRLWIATGGLVLTLLGVTGFLAARVLTFH
jgi:hypothetical protein